MRAMGQWSYSKYGLQDGSTEWDQTHVQTSWPETKTAETRSRRTVALLSNWSRDFNRSLLLFSLYASPQPYLPHTHKNNHSHIPVQTIGHYSPEPHFSPPSELLHSLHDRRLGRYLWARFSLAVGCRTVASFSKHIRGLRLWVGNLLSWAQVKKSLCQNAAQLYHKPYQMKPFCMINPAKKYYLYVRKSVLDIHIRKR